MTVPARGFRVVVIDDMEANLILLANLLQEAGYDVRVGNSATRGLAMIERQPPDLVLLDINLGDRDGFAVCAEMKSKEALRAIPVLFLSAHDDAATRARAFEAGGAEYLTKPFDPGEILARVAQHTGLLAARLEAKRAHEANAQLLRNVRELANRLHAPDPADRPTAADFFRLLDEDSPRSS